MPQIGDALLVIVFLSFFLFFPWWCEVMTQVTQVRVGHRKKGERNSSWKVFQGQNPGVCTNLGCHKRGILASRAEYQNIEF